MNAQRVGVTALRRVAKPPSVFAPAFSRALIVPTTTAMQTRRFTTEKITPSQANDLLASQRLHRPLSPHLEIYDKKQTFFGASILQRFTGGFYAAALYGGSLAYLAAPLVGWHLESASLAAFVAGLPIVAKGLIKFTMAWPFVFHAINGARHLVWDFAVSGFAKPEIKRNTNIILAASVLTSLGFAFLL